MQLRILSSEHRMEASEACTHSLQNAASDDGYSQTMRSKSKLRTMHAFC